MGKIAIALLFFLLLGQVSAAPVTAIGTFTRRIDSPIAKEVILRFPIFLSKAYLRANKGRVMYPHEFNRLCEENKIPLKILYTPEEYAAIAKVINGGALITGEIYEYTPETEESDENEDAKDYDSDLPEETLVFAKIHHYSIESKKIVSFSIYAKPENIVLEIVRRLLPLEKERYLLRPIPAKSKIAVIAPLDAPSLNNFLVYLMQLQFDVRMATGSDYNYFFPQELELLRELHTKTVSYSSPTWPDQLVVPPLSAALDNAAERADYNSFAALYSDKVTGFERKLGDILHSFKRYSGADYLLVLQPFGKRPFARGFDLNSGGLAWFQDSFPVKSGAEPGEVLATMISEMQRPIKTLSESQFEQIAQEKDRMVAQGAAGGLASVAILDFYDRTNSPLYGWMSSSLSSAVDDSMQKIFEYNRADEKISSAVGAKIFRNPSDATEKNLSEFQKKTGADYLIFGFYSLNAQTGKIVIESKVFDLVKKKAIGGSITESPVDTRLFNAVDEIAQGIVQDIFTMTQTQNK